jgi:16S rRNA (cytidine1402-2'-O)-methyltransferase
MQALSLVGKEPTFQAEDRAVGLIIVPTPLGNLRDITLRALDSLRDCDLLVAEDTRTAMRLLNALALPSKPIWSYREQNAPAVTNAILERAKDSTVAVTTDAGMPGISDPGRDLIAAARASGIPVEVLPGACAFVCAAVLSGFRLEGFSFEGFVPRAKGERARAFRAAMDRGSASAWYESPKRILATLASLHELEPDIPIFLVRELTKLHEQQLSGTPAEVAAALGPEPRGEVALVIDGIERHALRDATDAQVDAEIDKAFASGASVADVARELARRNFGSRADLYRRASGRRSEVTKPT